MSSSTSIDTTSLEVMHAANKQIAYIRHPTDRVAQIVFDTWWKEMKMTTKKAINWSGRKTSPAWRFYKQCAIAENGRPHIICIVCLQLIAHPAENGTTAMTKHLDCREHVKMLNELTDSQKLQLSSTAVAEEALDVLKKK